MKDVILVELTVTVLLQVLIMMLLIAVGMITFHTGLVNQDGKRQLADLLLYIITPAVILNAYQCKFQLSLAKGLLWSFALALLTHFVGFVVAALFFHKKDSDGRYRLHRFCSVYSNCGFMAIPLVQSLLGEEGVFYASAYITVFNLLSWTHGIVLLNGKPTSGGLKRVLFSPVVISVFLGLAIFFMQIRLPSVLTAPIGYLANVNTPLAMIVTGVSIAQTRVASAFTDKKIWAVTAVRNLVIPILVLLVLRLLPLDRTVLLTTLIESACPAAAVSVIFSTKFGLDTSEASKIVAVTTIASVLTIPAVVFLFGI